MLGLRISFHARRIVDCGVADFISRIEAVGWSAARIGVRDVTSVATVCGFHSYGRRTPDYCGLRMSFFLIIAGISSHGLWAARVKVRDVTSVAMDSGFRLPDCGGRIVGERWSAGCREHSKSVAARRIVGGFHLTDCGRLSAARIGVRDVASVCSVWGFPSNRSPRVRLSDAVCGFHPTADCGASDRRLRCRGGADLVSRIAAAGLSIAARLIAGEG